MPNLISTLSPFAAMNEYFPEDFEFEPVDIEGEFISEPPEMSEEFCKVLPSAFDFSKIAISNLAVCDTSCNICTRKAPFVAIQHDRSCSGIICYECYRQTCYEQQIFDNGNQFRSESPFLPYRCPFCRCESSIEPVMGTQFFVPSDDFMRNGTAGEAQRALAKMKGYNRKLQQGSSAMADIERSVNHLIAKECRLRKEVEETRKLISEQTREFQSIDRSQGKLQTKRSRAKQVYKNLRLLDSVNAQSTRRKSHPRQSISSMLNELTN